MNIVLNAEYDKKVHEEWVNLINHRPVALGVVRPEILETWQLCMQNGLDTDVLTPESSVQSTARLTQLLESNKLMCDIAQPFMDRISQNIPGPSSVVSLLDHNGYPLLRVASDENPEYDKYLQTHGLLPGAFPKKDLLPGFPEIFLCKKTLQPAYCYGEENYFVFSKDWMCVAAPILSDSGTLQGILSISDTKTNYDRQSMALAISTAKAIENEILMSKINRSLSNTAKLLSATIEQVADGLILVDQEGSINHANAQAKSLLHLDDSVQGRFIGEVLRDENGTFSSIPLQAIAEKEIMLDTNEGFKRYYISVRTFEAQNDAAPLGLITIKASAYARKLTNSVNASYAKFDFSNIIGRSAKINDAVNMAKIASKSTSTVLITGPSGTGKELFAHAIHSASSRSDGPFVSINCGALPANLVESELFGYEGGSFTGSRKNGQMGKFELADHGTLFLDEIGEMPLSVQASILRAIETKEVMRIGGSKSTLVDVRIVAATNRNLLDAISEKQFREDLYYRLNILRIHVPPLCERTSDIHLIANKFLETYSKQLQKKNLTLADDTYALLEGYNWPGNVRELENLIERAVNVTESNCQIQPQLIRMFIDMDAGIPSSGETVAASPSSTQIRDVERNLIIRTLTETNGSITKTAEQVGLGRRTLYRKCEEYGIDYNSFR